MGFPTRPIILLRNVDLRERFGRSDDATVDSSRDGVEAVEKKMATLTTRRHQTQNLYPNIFASDPN